MYNTVDLSKLTESCNTEIDERLIRIVLILGSAFMTFNYPEVIDKGGMKTIQYSPERMIHIDKCPIAWARKENILFSLISGF